MPEPTRRRQVVVVVAFALIVIAAAGLVWLETCEDNQPADTAVAQEATNDNPAVSEPDCRSVLRVPAGEDGDHIDDEPITYPAPPSFGDHRSHWQVRAASFYDVDSRPDVAVLVHNLEHGYNILWYDQTVADDEDALALVREIADGYAGLDGAPDPATGFIAAPWTAGDGDAFPAGMHYALTHWYADPHDRTRSRSDEVGLTRYCADVNAETVQSWMDHYPLTNAPEGYPDLM
ncbi:MAG: DUF3105 domain-containing protein [Actinomycetota bacterium]|nr:DUF3105 domain-containing protein [Actinomycetota bacterium]